jgi:hypothetical protein
MTVIQTFDRMKFHPVLPDFFQIDNREGASSQDILSFQKPIHFQNQRVSHCSETCEGHGRQ